MSDRTLRYVLLREQKHKVKNGIYHKLQVDFAYNSNHMEGSQLSHEQTQYIYDTKTVGIEPVRVDDVFETVNHFRCFDKILQGFDAPLTINLIKSLHAILKNGTLSSELPEAVVGDYKKYPNYVGDMKTTAPAQVESEIDELLYHYNKISAPKIDDILDFHAMFEKIHPFFDGNGRVGRLIMFRECLKNDIVPFIITDQYKGYYYRGLKEWQSGGERGYLRDTCLLMQDQMKLLLDYFEIDY